MDPESESHSFVIRIWVEETVEKTGRVSWRGHITHVGDGKRRHFQNLDDLIEFIAEYLHSMGIRVGGYWAIRQRIRQLQDRDWKSWISRFKQKV